MRLYGAIQKIEPLDDGTVRVHGIATSEAMDDQGEIVRADAMRAAIPGYMRFPALREMHQLSAAGTTLEAEVCEDGTTRIVAHVVDPLAVAKVKNQVYRGFSIGGRVTRRDAGNPKAITSLVLNEISLVDRPANPEAIFDCWKAAVAADLSYSPIQIWACGVPDHSHLAKADALKCIEDRHVEPTHAKASTAETGGPEDTGSVDDRAKNAADCDQLSSMPPAPASPVNTHAAALSDKGQSKLRQFAFAALAKAQLSQADQAILDMACLACDTCLKIGGLSVDRREKMTQARDCLQIAGAMPVANPIADTTSYAAGSGNDSAAEADTAEMSGTLAAAPQHMMDTAHGCLRVLTDGTVCAAGPKFGGRRPMGMMEHLEMAHAHMTAAGARCDRPASAGSDTLTEAKLPAEFAPGKGANAGDLAKGSAGRHAEDGALVKAVEKIFPMLEQLSRRIDDIARTPLPPLTIAKSSMAVSKHHDHGGGPSRGEPELSPEAIAAALAKMSQEEQTLTLIKASYANPIRVFGSALDQR